MKFNKNVQSLVNFPKFRAFLLLMLFIGLIFKINIFYLVRGIFTAKAFDENSRQLQSFMAKDATNFEWDEAFYGSISEIKEWYGNENCYTFGRYAQSYLPKVHFFKDKKLVRSMELLYGDYYKINFSLEYNPNQFRLGVYNDLFRFTPDTVFYSCNWDIHPKNGNDVVLVRRTYDYNRPYSCFLDEKNTTFKASKEKIRFLVFPVQEYFDSIYIATDFDELKIFLENLYQKPLKPSEMAYFPTDMLSYVVLTMDGKIRDIQPFYNDKLVFADDIAAIEIDELLHCDYNEETEVITITRAK